MAPSSPLLAWYDRHTGTRSTVLSWVLTRLFSLVLLATAERLIVGDVFYYRRKIAALLTVGLDDTMYEYPTPVVWILSLPFGPAFGTRTGYLIGFIVLMLALDAGFSYALWRSAGRRRDRGLDFWLLFVPLLGPLCFVRFDILPAVLAGGALLAARQRPRVAGALVGLGAAIKLWPALLIPFLLADRRTRRPVALGFVVVGFGLAALSLVFGGFRRLISPLTWQSGRGLQIESIWATPVMTARALRPSGWSVSMSRYQAYEIFGPGVSPWVTVSSVATVAGLVLIVLLAVRGFRSAGTHLVGVGFGLVATVAIMTITNKTLSPQYLLWLAGPMAALILLRDRGSDSERASIRRVALQLLVLALLTHLVYPLFYNGTLGRSGHAALVGSTLLTAVRNLALVAFTVEVCVVAWRSLGTSATDR